ncbi:MAG: NHL repeat-containing protein [Planctomycetota bacterium]
MLTISRLSDSTRPAPLWLFLALSITISVPKTGLALQEVRRDPGRPTLLALDNCNSDDEQGTSSHRDALLLLNSQGQLVRQIPRLTVARGFSGCRGISVSPDGRFFVVCDHSQGIGLYRISSGTEVWSLSGFFRSAVFADGLIYALGPHGIYAIDREGTIIKHSRFGGGVDIVFNSLDKSLWIVGTTIRRYTLDLRLLFKVRPPFSTLNAGAFSVDLNPNGSVWIASRNAYEREGIANRLMKISPAGEILKAIHLDFCPQRVRVDKSDGSVWTTGRVRRQDYSRIGDTRESATNGPKLWMNWTNW